MNEVTFTKTAVQPSVVSASSKGSVQAKPQVSGNSLPTEAEIATATAAPKAQPVSAEQLKNEVAKVNDYVQTVQRDLQFSVDDELERTVIRVVDSDSGELIRQIPEDIFLELARRLKDDGEVNLLSELG